MLMIRKKSSEDNDSGYAVQNYRRVNLALGMMDDLAALAGDLHTNGISLYIDLMWHGKLRGEVRNLLDLDDFRPMTDFSRV